MKKQLFTLLTLLVMCVTGAWAADVTASWLAQSNSMNLNGSTTDVNGLIASNGSMTSALKTVSTWYKSGTYYLTFDRNDETQDTKGTINESRYIDFTATVASGKNFTLNTVQAVGIGAGTGNNSFRVDFIDSKGTTTLREAGTIGSGTEAEVNHTFASPETYSAGSTITIRIYIGINNTDESKNVGLRDVKMIGTYTTASTDPVPASITTQPSNTGAVVGVETTLSVVAAGYPAPDYQWYECDDAEKTNATAINGATSSSYSFTPDATGTRYFYVTVNNENNESPVASNVVSVTSSTAATDAPTFKVYGNTIQLACATADATIYYELDNADVKSSATKSTYSGAFIPASSGTIYAYAQKDGYTSSTVVSKAVTLSTVGNVVGDLIATVQAESKATTTKFGNITVTSPESPTWDGRGVYPNHMKVSGTVTLTASNGSMISSIKVYGTSNDGSKVATVTAGDGATVISNPAELMQRDVTVGGVQTMTELIITVDEPAANNSVSFTLGREARLYIEVYGTNPINLNTSGYSTFSSSLNLQVTGADAYTAQLDIENSKITCTKIADGKIPAGNGVLLYGAENAEVTFTVIESAPALENNDLKATTLADGSLATMGNNTYYVLSGDTFMRYNGNAFAAGKAYFDPSNTQARSLTMTFENEMTGIGNVQETKGSKADGCYNLAGQRVSNPTKGLYIMNGKKYIVK